MEEKGQEGEADHVLTLFDIYWFHRQILRPPPPPPPPSPALPPPLMDREDAGPQSSEPPPASRPSLLLRRHQRSLSDEAAPSAELRIQTSKLQTILSGKEGSVGGEPPQNGESAGGENLTAAARRRRRGRRRGRSRGKSRSLSGLEFEELRGFMDLGFTFSDAEADPRLMSIVPGLQRLGKRAAGDGEPAAKGSSCASEEIDESAISRPYLSEAWEAQGEEKAENPLKNWRIPKAADGVDLKDHLRSWAHAVASTVR